MVLEADAGGTGVDAAQRMDAVWVGVDAVRGVDEEWMGVDEDTTFRRLVCKRGECAVHAPGYWRPVPFIACNFEGIVSSAKMSRNVTVCIIMWTSPGNVWVVIMATSVKILACYPCSFQLEDNTESQKRGL
ncbi:hypothetical protein AAES_99821 [Amazona aestiva]|uniref:Uncharacterized protein n=1 Tax=Amazona aestiva TaxID=12930 RepID=A0A0Q3MB44_AMAAE|nr:hypothetical protein AAES_99821 [Amazona aestiva]